MDQVDFADDEGFRSLSLIFRNPADMSLPAENLRLDIHCSDCVAGLTVDADSFGQLLQLLRNPPSKMNEAKSWTAPMGEWTLEAKRIESGFQITSTADSLLDIHRWKLVTSFELSASRLSDIAAEVEQFLGAVD